MFSPTTIEKVSALAKSLKIEPAALLAVADVESAGVTEWTVGGVKVPAIRFEGHYFYRLLAAKDAGKLRQAVAQGLANPKAGAVKNPNSYSARYDLLERARKIDRAAADESTSWGLGQVMGDHWEKLGFSSIADLVSMAMSGVDGQIELMSRYIRVFGLTDELRGREWLSFALQYNGPSARKGGYEKKIAAAYKRYSIKGAPDLVNQHRSANDPVVREYQTKLKRLGFYKGPVDGCHGPLTTAAVKGFQTANGLVADGKFGKMTDEALDAEIAKLDGKKGDTAVKTGTGITGTGAVVDIINQQADKLDAIKDFSPIITWITVALVVTGVAVTLYGVLKRMKAKE